MVRGSTRQGRIVLLLAFVLALATAGCATPQRPDPLEKMNRSIFAFNEKVDQIALEPVAKGWDYVVPGPVQDGIENFYTNLGMPLVIANEILQAKPARVVEDVARFFFNSTLGIGGFFDVATRVGIPDNDEDFGQTLGHWGVPPGAYLVMPILGPFTVRDGFGEMVDTTAGAWGYMNFFWFDVVGLNGWQTTVASIGSRSFRLINLRAIYLEEIASSREDAFDYYAFVRNAYLSNREARVLDSTDAAAGIDEDLYEFDEEDDFDEEGDAASSEENEAEDALGDATDEQDEGEDDAEE
jgi:phospholipid-binding lipoprotein MlaA